MPEKNKLDELLQTFNNDREIAVELKTVARELVLEAKAEALKTKEQADHKLEQAQKIESVVSELKKKLEVDLEGLQGVYKEERLALEKVGSLSKSEAEAELMRVLEKELADEVAKRIREAEEKIKSESDKRAREILVAAMYRVGNEGVAEHTIYTIDLPDESMKGRIIGKDGRNIKAFEDAAGVGVEIGEEEEATVTISSFDPVKREIAKRTMEKLIADGRIQPTRIEELLQKSQQEVDKVTREAGEDLMYRANVSGLPDEIVDLLGRLKFRTSYGQNMIEHTLEVVRLGVAIAAEVGADLEIVKRGCLLHDLGKAITAETDKGHAEAGADICRRYGISEDVVVAFEGHHTDNLPTSEAVVVYLADAISGARPGARKGDYEGYVNRVKELESIASSFKGVDRCFAISAGREVRVLVNPAVITDAEMVKLAHDISRKIHEQVQNFPGQIKISVIRETKATSIAKARN